jgi:hypothetical protein
MAGYHGRQRPDGVLVADQAVLRPNIVAEREQHPHAKYAYDPKSALPASRPQDLAGYVACAFAGNNPKHIPPAVDPILQQRLDTIGQRAGVATILEKQQLRFQLELRMLGATQLAGWVPVSAFTRSRSSTRPARRQFET